MRKKMQQWWWWWFSIIVFDDTAFQDQQTIRKYKTKSVAIYHFMAQMPCWNYIFFLIGLMCFALVTHPFLNANLIPYIKKSSRQKNVVNLFKMGSIKCSEVSTKNSTLGPRGLDEFYCLNNEHCWTFFGQIYTHSIKL